MKRTLKSVATGLKRLSLGIGAIILLVGLTIGGLPYLFPGFITEKLNEWTASHLKGKLVFSDATLSFFARFPNLTLTLHDVTLNGSAPFERDTLIAAREISLGVDLSSLLEKRIEIDKVFLADGRINVQVDKEGRANYNVYAASTDSVAAPKDTSSTALTIEKIQIERTNILYNDLSIPILVRAKGVFYEGKGDLSKDIFDLYTHTHIDSVDLYYDNQPYALGKQVNADLITQVNTTSLAFVFAKNDLKINKLPVQFKGKFAFLRDGYTMDFKANSVETDLHNIITALPPDLVRWAAKTDINGFGAFGVSLAGEYSAVNKTKPELQLNVALRDGSIAYEKAPDPVRNLRLDLAVKLPNLNPEELDLAMDSLYFTINKDFFSSRLRVKGFSKPNVHALVSTDLDLEKWDKAFGIPLIDVKGRYRLNLQADGDYIVTQKRISAHKVEQTISSIPRFTLTSSLENGYFKYDSLPQPIRDVRFNLDASCPDQDYQHTQVALRNLQIKALQNVIRGFVQVSNPRQLAVTGRLDAILRLDELKSFYPLNDSLQLAGKLTIEAETEGKYVPEKRQFPITKAIIQLTDGTVQTKYYPHPIERIHVNANILSTSPSLNTLKVGFSPISFSFEGQPFKVQADLKNFDNLTYAITSQGTVDVGKLYQVVAQQGYDVKGKIKTDFSLRGNQSDATAGRYDQLFNKGTVQVNDLLLSSDMFPLPFLIKTGLFRFDQDKVWFDKLWATYGSSTVDMNGYLTNVIDYLTKPLSPLRGSFTLNSNSINVDEFMAFASKPTPSGKVSSSSSGVVVVPPNLAVEVKATAKRVSYNGLALQDAHGQMTIDSGRIKLQQTGFTVIGTPVTMDATYQSISPKRAAFDYHINAIDFDIKRAYREITLFRTLATSAAKAEGLVSLDYQLGGKLDANMDPILPSLMGGGVLSVRKVKMNGFRLFGAVSKKTGHDISNPDISEVSIKTTIAKNTMTLARTKLRIAGFRPRLEGKVGLDGKLNLNFRLGLPPLGILGVPMTITGTQTNPKVKLGKNKEDKDESEQ
ncbi:AsmA family protein [Spirosoma foliorum]|uniref:AsmA family protein n=1 Tax=Spirosoma foliorum TaxID=2710596 RepID=A0A7G5GP03_9BACT|nr:AsmA family protein [Spirosoma foliorum]QMW00595.1 AsmA family protein [Spirosoma foliorum]